MTRAHIAQPDVTLFLDLAGFIENASVSSALSETGVEGWLGRPWVETVRGIGSDKVKRMIDDASRGGVSAFYQVTQLFPSGLELPVEYTTVRLGGDGGLIAVGKTLEAVTQLESRLVATQRAMERDYWKLREVETRYRLLFNASNEAVLLIRAAANFRIVDANPEATRALGLAQTPENVVGRELLPLLGARQREAFREMISRVHEHGKAPGMLVHLGQDPQPWVVRASLVTSEPGPVFLLQLSALASAQPVRGRSEQVSIPDLIERVPDGFVVVDFEGVIRRANRAFLDLIEISAEELVVGERLARWLWQPGADVHVLLANVRRDRVVRLFSNTIHGALGTDTEVEISAASNADTEPVYVGVLLRKVSRRLPAANDTTHLLSALGSMSAQIGSASLRTLVEDSVGLVERHCIKAALELAGGNRTAAAELLGLSRPSLYSKLNRYSLDARSRTPLGSSD